VYASPTRKTIQKRVLQQANDEQRGDTIAREGGGRAGFRTLSIEFRAVAFSRQP